VNWSGERAAKLEAHRDADLAKLEQRVRNSRSTAAAKIAQVKKEIAKVVADLKTDHTAEEAAALLTLTVEQYNNILYNGRAKVTPFQADASEPHPATAVDTSNSAETTPTPPPVEDEHSAKQFSLFVGANPAPSSSVESTLKDTRRVVAPTRDQTAAASTSADLGEPE
jgi:hypothetical protein